jgi:hypothetical protein
VGLDAVEDGMEAELEAGGGGAAVSGGAAEALAQVREPRGDLGGPVHGVG